MREDIEEEDDQVLLFWITFITLLLSLSVSFPFSLKESYFKAMANAPLVILDEENEQDIDYDSDGNPIIPESAKVRYLTTSN